MTLLEKQTLFAYRFSKLIQRAFDLGYEVTIGEVERSKLQAEANAKNGNGIKNSLHLIRLAGDLHLFKDDKYLDKTEDHKFLGEYWESLSDQDSKCCWGGRFGDGNHYSIEHEGRK